MIRNLLMIVSRTARLLECLVSCLLFIPNDFGELSFLILFACFTRYSLYAIITFVLPFNNSLHVSFSLFHCRYHSGVYITVTQQGYHSGVCITVTQQGYHHSYFSLFYFYTYICLFDFCVKPLSTFLQSCSSASLKLFYVYNQTVVDWLQL